MAAKADLYRRPTYSERRMTFSFSSYFVRIVVSKLTFSFKNILISQYLCAVCLNN